MVSDFSNYDLLEPPNDVGRTAKIFRYSSTDKNTHSMKPILKNASNNLIRLLQTANAHQSLLELAKNVLPDEVAEHLIGIDFEEQTLTIVIDHEAWATHVRFFENAILARFHDNFQHLQLQRVKVKVTARRIQYERPPYEHEKLNEENAKALIQTSERVDSPKLRDALKRLSQHRKD